MNYLLDTHTFLWSALQTERLSKKVRTLLLDNRNTVYVSSVSFWEISLKYGIGKIELKNLHPDELPTAAQEMGFDILDVDYREAASFHKLPRQNHKDPFDRMIVWQAIHNDLVLVSKDKSMSDYRQYGLEMIW
jgi:PIN domain nuclease of toxin-antitoxin system